MFWISKLKKLKALNSEQLEHATSWKEKKIIESRDNKNSRP